MALTALKEYCASSKVAAFRDGNTLHGIRLVGLKSKHGHLYALEALVEAVPLFNNQPVYENHPKQNQENREVSEWLGHLRNVDSDANGLFGSFELNPHHPLRESIEYCFDNSIECIGISFTGEGDKDGPRGKQVVKKITRVDTIDLVMRPATTTSLREDMEEHTGEDGKMSHDELCDMVAEHHARLDEYHDRLTKMEEMMGTREEGGSPATRGEGHETRESLNLQVANLREELGQLRATKSSGAKSRTPYPVPAPQQIKNETPEEFVRSITVTGHIDFQRLNR